MSSNKRKVTTYGAITSERVYFGSGVQVNDSASGPTTAGWLGKNTTTGAIEVVGTADSTYHSVALHPAVVKTWSGLSVADSTSVYLDLSSSTSYLKKVTTTNTLGSNPVVDIGQGGTVSGSAFVTVSATWQANATGERVIQVSGLRSDGSTDLVSHVIGLSYEDAQPSGTTDQSLSVMLDPHHTATAVDAFGNITSTGNVAGIAVIVAQYSGSTLTCDLRVTMTSV